MTLHTADVYPYEDAYEPIANAPIITGANSWTHPIDQRTYILIFNELLYYWNKLNHSLINPNQLHHNGVNFYDNPWDSLHDLSIQIDRGPTIPLMYEGMKLILATHVSTQDELDNCTHIEMTLILPWQPWEVRLGAVAWNNVKRSIFSTQVANQHIIVHPLLYAEK